MNETFSQPAKRFAQECSLFLDQINKDCYKFLSFFNADVLLLQRAQTRKFYITRRHFLGATMMSRRWSEPIIFMSRLARATCAIGVGVFEKPPLFRYSSITDRIVSCYSVNKRRNKQKSSDFKIKERVVPCNFKKV